MCTESRCDALEYHQVVTSFLANAQEILLLRRSSKVGSHRGKWSAVSGYLEGPEQPLIRAVTEIHEEVGLSKEQINLVRIGETLRAYDEENDCVWIINPFLFEATTRDIKLDWENTEHRWVLPSQLTSYSTVPKLREALDRVQYDLQSIPASLIDLMHKVKQVEEDRAHGAAFIGQEAIRVLSQVAEVSDAKDPETFFSHLLLVGLRLRQTQPAMANVWNLIGKLLQTVENHRAEGSTVEELQDLLQKTGAQMSEQETKASEDVSRNAVRVIPRDGIVLTHSYSSAVLRSLVLEFKAGNRFKVYATESYPGMEGKELAKELIATGVPVTLIADSAVSAILPEVDVVLFGADSVLRDGSLVHKVGTRDIASAAKQHAIPVFSLCESAKLSVRHFLGEEPKTGILFDITPAESLMSYITEEGELLPINAEQRLRVLQKEIYP